MANRLRLLRNHGITRNPEAFTQDHEAFDTSGQANPWYYEMVELGLNYRASDIQCALGQSQLRKLPTFVARRHALVEQYDELLADFAPILTPLARSGTGAPAWHLYVVLIDFAELQVERGAFMDRLRAAGIGTQVHYLPLHRQPYYRERYGAQTLPGADSYYAHCLSLPLFPDMTDQDVVRVAQELGTALTA
jgi:dTDP-4-amino-4,6-dideoxygalactose transaminase